VLVASASALRASVSTALASFAAAERLVGLSVVVLDDSDDIAVELAVRGFACETVGAAAQLAGALARARGRGRPAVILYRGPSRPAPVMAELPRPSRTPVAVPFDGPARDVGAFAAGVALRKIPLAVVPLADADALKPALRLNLPTVFVATEDT